MIGANLSLLIHLFASLCFVGIIWYVQLIAYPQFRMVSVHDWIPFEKNHTRRSFWLIAPLFVLETLGMAGTAIYYVTSAPLLIIGSTVCYLIAYIATFTIHMPLHRLLSTSHQTKWIDRLITTNWYRTVAWTLKGLLALLLALNVLSGN